MKRMLITYLLLALTADVLDAESLDKILENVEKKEEMVGAENEDMKRLIDTDEGKKQVTVKKEEEPSKESGGSGGDDEKKTTFRIEIAKKMSENGLEEKKEGDEGEKGNEDAKQKMTEEKSPDDVSESSVLLLNSPTSESAESALLGENENASSDDASVNKLADETAISESNAKDAPPGGGAGGKPGGGAGGPAGGAPPGGAGGKPGGAPGGAGGQPGGAPGGAGGKPGGAPGGAGGKPGGPAGGAPPGGAGGKPGGAPGGAGGKPGEGAGGKPGEKPGQPQMPQGPGKDAKQPSPPPGQPGGQPPPGGQGQQSSSSSSSSIQTSTAAAEPMGQPPPMQLIRDLEGLQDQDLDRIANFNKSKSISSSVHSSSISSTRKSDKSKKEMASDLINGDTTLEIIVKGGDPESDGQNVRKIMRNLRSGHDQNALIEQILDTFGDKSSDGMSELNSQKDDKQEGGSEEKTGSQTCEGGECRKEDGAEAMVESSREDAESLIGSSKKGSKYWTVLLGDKGPESVLIKIQTMTVIQSVIPIKSSIMVPTIDSKSISKAVMPSSISLPESMGIFDRLFSIQPVSSAVSTVSKAFSEESKEMKGKKDEKKDKKKDEKKDKKKDEKKLSKSVPATSIGKSASKGVEKTTKTISLIYTITKRQYIHPSISSSVSKTAESVASAVQSKFGKDGMKKSAKSMTSSVYSKFGQDGTKSSKRIEGYLTKQVTDITFNISSEIAKISSKLSSCDIGTVSVMPLASRPSKYVLSLNLPTKKDKTEIKSKKTAGKEDGKKNKAVEKDDKLSNQDSKLTGVTEDHGMLDVFNFLKKIPEEEVRSSSAKDDDSKRPAVFVSGALKTGPNKENAELSNKSLKFWGFVQNLLESR